MNQNSENDLKRRTARLSIFSNSFLISIKLISGILSGSVSIISEAIHSGLDLVASVVAYLAVRISAKPADEEHPYGHGKFENVSGVVESLLIFAAAIWIVYEAIDKIFHPQHLLHDSGLKLGILVMFISAIINFFVSRKLYKVSKLTDSVALEADALHLKTDVYTSLGVSVGLLLMYITSWYILDPLIAIFVALLIIFEAYHMLMKSFNPLLDSNLPKSELENIKHIIEPFTHGDFQCKNLRSRKSGQNIIVEFTLIAPANFTLLAVNNQANEIRNALINYNSRFQILILYKPC